MRALRTLPILASGLLAIALTSAPASAGGEFSFTIADVEGRVLHFKGDAGTTWTEANHSCEQCTLLVSARGVQGSTEESSQVPGALLRLSSDGDSVAVTCRGDKCLVDVLGTSGEVQTTELERHAKLSFPVAASVRVTVVD